MLTPLQGGHHLTSRLHKAMHGILPGKYSGDSEYDAHCHVYGRAHAHQDEYDIRRQQYHRNKAAISVHNAQAGATYEQALNHLADWTAAEFSVLTKVRPIFFILARIYCYLLRSGAYVATCAGLR
jgi:hypothetical protein